MPATAALSMAAVQRPGPWWATRRFFACTGVNTNLENEKTKPTPSAVSQAAGNEGRTAPTVIRDVFCLSGNYSYETLVATIPDPRRTRLGLFTDRVLENIQRGAANRLGIRFAVAALQDSPDADERDPEKRLRQRAAVNQEQSEPGILVFRHQPVRENEELRFHRRLLLVFIVGETPTAGINKAQFIKAREYAGKIVTLPQAGESQPVQPSLRVLGPTFSGSFASLAELVRSSEGRLNIVSGTVTGKRYAAAFLSTVKPLDRVRFASARVYDEDLDFPLKQVLKKLKISPQDVVSLVEDESGYGNSQTYVPRPLKPGEKAPTKVFPQSFFLVRFRICAMLIGRP